MDDLYETDDDPPVPEGGLLRTLPIINRRGLHARASAKLTKLAGSYPCEVWMSRGERRVNAKSIMGVMMLAAGPYSLPFIEEAMNAGWQGDQAAANATLVDEHAIRPKQVNLGHHARGHDHRVGTLHDDGLDRPGIAAPPAPPRRTRGLRSGSRSGG